MAVVELVGGGGSVRVSSGKRARGGEREQRERKRSEGTRGGGCMENVHED